MRSALPLVLFAISGCDLVYGLGDRVAPDAPPEVDAPPDIDAPPPCTRRTASVVAVADTMLIRDNAGACDPGNRFGGYINVNLGQPASASTRSRILVRFALLPEMVEAFAPGGGFESGTLTIPLKPDACAAPCPSSAMQFSIFAANNDWNEGQNTGNIGAAWCMRKQLGGPGTGTMWMAQGADGATDRSMVSLADVTVIDIEAQQDRLFVPIDLVASQITEARNWIDGMQLSLLLVPTTTTGTLYTKAREDSQAGGGMQLSITSCR